MLFPLTNNNIALTYVGNSLSKLMAFKSNFYKYKKHLQYGFYIFIFPCFGILTLCCNKLSIGYYNKIK